MSSSKAITEDREDRLPSGGWQPAAETAPSVLREDRPTAARVLAAVGAALVLVCGIVLIANVYGRALAYGGRAFLGLALGAACLLYHATADKKETARRGYLMLAVVLFAAGTILEIVKYKGEWGGAFLPGFLCSGLALLFALAPLRNETDEQWRELTTLGLAVVGAGLAVVGFVGGLARPDFLLPYGVMLAGLGLCYLWAFVSQRGVSDEYGFRAALGIGGAGLLVVVIAAVRAAVVPGSLVPNGLVVIGLGLLYALFAAGLIAEGTFIALTRRELAAFFFSPIAYIVLIGITVVAWVCYLNFLSDAIRTPPESPFAPPPPAMAEPIVRHYAWGLLPVIAFIVVIPLLTMRLLSEEKRSGTLEVLLTAPVSETTVVLSKFAAALVFFLITWVPWALFLVSLRVEGGQPFDFRPLLSFLVAMLCMGSGFLAMGLFFSSLTQNQIASFVLTFAGMLGFTALSLAHWELEARGQDPNSPWGKFLTHTSYLDVWWDSLRGVLMPMYLLFFVSAAVFFLFLTVKVLEARKWKS